MSSTNTFDNSLKKFQNSKIKFNVGEKGSIQHTMYGMGDKLPKWCNALVALSIGSVRGNTSKQPITKSSCIPDIGIKESRVIDLLKNVYFEIDAINDKDEKFEAINNLIVFMFNLRHVPQRSEYGRGERLLSYWIFLELYKRYPYTMLILLHEIPNYGSYLDLTKLYELIFKKQQSDNYNFKILQDEIEKIFAVQLKLDEETLLGQEMNKNKNNNKNDEKDFKDKPTISLCAKWFPKENGAVNKYTGITNKICKLLYPNKWNQNKFNALKDLRKLVSMLNKTIKTTEVYMSNNEFHKINFQLVPGRCLNKFKKAWLDVDKYGLRKNPSNKYRTLAARNYSNFIDLAKKGKINTKGRSLFIHEIVSKVINHYETLSKEDIDLLNLQFLDHSNYIKLKGKEYDLGEGIPVVDVSGSMHGDPMNAAIGIGIILSENAKNSYKDYVITFDNNPTLIKLKYPETIGEYDLSFSNDYNTFKPYKCLDWDSNRCGGELTPVEKILVLKNCPWGGSTNIHSTFELLIDIAKQGNSDLLKKLYILTDMQWDQVETSRIIKTKTSISGLKELVNLNNLTFPEIICWNLRGNTRGYISTADSSEVKMVSGFSLNMLKLFLYNGDLQCSNNSSFDSWDLLQKCLYSSDYDRIRLLIIHSTLGDFCNKKNIKKPKPIKTINYKFSNTTSTSLVNNVFNKSYSFAYYAAKGSKESMQKKFTKEDYAIKMADWIKEKKSNYNDDNALKSIESALYNDNFAKKAADRMASGNVPVTSDQGKSYLKLNDKVNKLSTNVSSLELKLDKVLINLNKIAGKKL